MSQDLLKQIDDLVASQTFSLDALEGIKSIKDNLKQTQSRLEQELLNTTKLTRDLVMAKSEIEKLNEQIISLQGKVAGMVDLANTGANAIWEKKISDASAAAYKDALYTVFKPSAVRETVQRNHTVIVPNGSGGGYPQAVSNQDFIVREDA